MAYNTVTVSALVQSLTTNWTGWVPTAVFFVLAVLSLWLSRKQLKRMEEIAEGTSTRFIGEFPEHLHAIAEVATRARHEILIMADCVDYGSFSDHEAHEAIIEALEHARKLARKVQIRILVCGEQNPFSRASPFYGRKFEELRQDNEFNECAERYFKRYPPKDEDPTPPSTFPDFATALKRVQGVFEARLDVVKVQIGKLPKERADLFLWIADSHDAVFLFPESEPGVPGLAFRTRESKLIEKNFKPIFERYWRKHQEQTGA